METITEEKAKIDLPLGQRLVAEGFKKITMADLRERFAIDEMQQAEQEAVIKKTIPENGYLRGKNQHGFSWDEKGFLGYFKDACYVDFDFKYTIQIRKFKAYVEEKIPDRCLETIEKVKELGLKKKQLYVAYPARNDVKRDDPVIIARLEEDVWLEIDMWE